MSLSVQYLNVSSVQTPNRASFAADGTLETGLEAFQRGETDIGHIMMMIGLFVQIDAALRAQSFAIRLAERLQRQLLHQGIAQQRLQIGP